MYKFTGVTNSQEFSLYADQPKEKSILIRLILVTVLVTGFFSFALLMCDDSYLLLLQERIAGEHKVFEEGMDLFSSSGLFEGIKATYETKTSEGEYTVTYGMVPEDKKIDGICTTYNKVWNACIELGYTAEVAAALCGNISCESGGVNVKTEVDLANSDLHDNDIGAYQFTGGHAKNYTKWSSTEKHKNHKKAKGKYGYFCTNAVCQTEYFVTVYSKPRYDYHLSKTFKDRIDNPLITRFNGKNGFCDSYKYLPDKSVKVPTNKKTMVECKDLKMITLYVFVNLESGGSAWYFMTDKAGTISLGGEDVHPGPNDATSRHLLAYKEGTKGYSNYAHSGYVNRYLNAKKIYDAFTKVAETNSGDWKYMPTRWIKKANIDTSKLSAKRQTIIDCMYWIVWNCWYTMSQIHGIPRRDNFDTILKDIKDKGYSASDCSGSIYAAYKKVGITIPTYTGAYPSRTSQEINKNDLAPGDILWTNSPHGHVVMFLGWKDKSAKTAWCAAMHGIQDGQKPWKDKTGNNCGDIKITNVNGFPRAYRFTPVGSGISASTSTVTTAIGSTSSVSAQQSESTMLVGNQIVVSACKQLGLSVKGSGSAEYVYNVKDSNWVYFAKEHTGLSYLNSKKDIIVNGLEAGMPLIILTGTNDTGKASKISELANSFGSKGTVYVCTLPPVSGSCSSVSNSNITTFNNTIKTGAQKYKVLDLHSYCSIESIKSSNGSTNYSKSDALKILKWIKEQVRR